MRTLTSPDPRRRGAVGLAIVIAIALAALFAGTQVHKLTDARGPDAGHAFTDTGRALGTAIGGPAVGELGAQLGTLLAVVLGVTAAQRHGAAAAANARLASYEGPAPARRRRRR